VGAFFLGVGGWGTANPPWEYGAQLSLIFLFVLFLSLLVLPGTTIGFSPVFLFATPYLLVFGGGAELFGSKWVGLLFSFKI